MKKIKFLVLICLLGILSTGCVKFNATMDIKKDKSMDFSIIYAVDKTIFGEANGLKEEDMAEAKKQGFTVTKYSEGNYEGFTLSKKIKNIDEVSTENDAEYDLSGLMEESSENKYLFKVVKGEEKNTYYAKFKFNANDSGLNMDDEMDNEFNDETLPDENDELDNNDMEGTGSLDNMDFSGMMANLDLSFNVNLPNSAISSNATNKENNDKKLTWKLNTQGEEYIEFAFELSNNAGGINMLYVGIGAGVLVLLIVIVLLISKKNKKTPEVVSNVSSETTVTPNNQENVTTEPEPVLVEKPDTVE